MTRLDPCRRVVAAVAAAAACLAPLPVIAAPDPDSADAKPGTEASVPIVSILDPATWQALDDVQLAADVTRWKLALAWDDPMWPVTAGYQPAGRWVEREYDPDAPDGLFGAGSAADGLDTRYFRGDAAAALWECAGDRLRAFASEGPEVVEAILRACMEQVWAALGEPCVTPEDDPGVCTSFDYHESWCGRRHVPATLEGSTCGDELTKAIDAWASSADAPAPEEVAIPLVTHGRDGEARHYVETAPGYRLHDRGAYYEWDEYVPFESVEFAVRRGLPLSTNPTGPSGGVTPNPVAFAFSTTPPRIVFADQAAYRANGGAIASCAEYAVESFYDFVVLDDWARATAPSDAELVDAAYDGNAAVAPIMTAAGDYDVRDKTGALTCTPGSAAAPCDLDHGHALGAARDSWLFRGPSGAITTFQNVFVYAAHVLAVDATPATTPAQLEARAAAREAAATHYTVDDRWHLAMKRALAGYHPDHLEDLRDVQRDAWAVFYAYERARGVVEHYTVAPRCETLAGATPSDPGMPPPFYTTDNCYSPWRMDAAQANLAAARAALEATLGDAGAYGCVPAQPGEVTPCDWAPSVAAEAIQRRFERHLKEAYARCVAEVGDLPLVEVAPPNAPPGAVHALEGVFVDPSTLVPAAGVPATCPLHGATAPTRTLTGDELARCRADLIAVPWLASRANLERYWRDRDRYVAALVAAVQERYADARLRGDAGDAKTGGNDYFGVTMQLLGDGGLGDSAGHVCDRGIVESGAITVDTALWGKTSRLGKDVHLDYDLGEEIAHGLDHPDEIRSAYGSGRGWQAQAGAESSWAWQDDAVPFEHTREIKGNVLWGPSGWGVGGTVSIPIASWRFGASMSSRIPLGPVDAVVSLGAGVRATLGLTASASLRRAFGPEDALCDAVSLSQSATASASAAAEGFVSVGIAYAVFEVGIRGTLTLIDLGASLGLSHALATEVVDGERKPTYDVEASFDVSLSFLSGRLSVYFAINLAFVSITVFELTLFGWRGPTYAIDLFDWQERDLDVCLVESVQSVFPGVAPDRQRLGTNRTGDPVYDLNCPCMPWDLQTVPECAPGYQAACGNEVIDQGEQCDDGNRTGGDGCSAACQDEEVPS